jgi:protein-disulfide isomerase
MKKETAVAAMIVLGIAAFVIGYVLGGQGGEGAGHDAGDHGTSHAAAGGTYDSSIVPLGSSPVSGPADAEATVVLFMDFANEAATAAAADIQEILGGSRVGSGSARLVVKFLPGTSEESRNAAVAALYAADNGRFFGGAYEALRSAESLSDDSLRTILQNAGVDPAGFTAALENDTYSAVLAADANLASGLGANRAPAVFINGRALPTAELTQDRLREVVLGEIAAVEEAVSRGDLEAGEAYAARTMTNAEVRPTRVARAERAERRAAAREGAAEARPERAAERPEPREREARRPAAPPSGDVERLRVPIGDSYVKGSDEALVTIAIFSDFHCPFCSRVNPTLEAIEEEYGDQVRFVFKHNPLPMHPNAPLASRAAMAAGEQGKFWEMHDLIFENQRRQERADMEDFAQQLGLDMAAFRAFLDSDRGNDQIAADQALGRQVGARGTPHFFINGRRLRGAQPLESFTEIIEQELALARQMVADGTPASQVYEQLMEGAQEQAAAEPARQEAPARVEPPPVGNSAARGPEDAPVTIFMFSEFQCPYCSRALAAVQQIEETYGDRVRFVFKSFPLPFHGDAHLASQAALAAGEQGKFWEYHDILFQNQRALSRSDLEGYAEQLGLDMARFREALDSGRFADQVDAEMAEGRAAGVSGTPTFLINGQRLVGAQPFESFQPIIEAALN